MRGWGLGTRLNEAILITVSYGGGGTGFSPQEKVLSETLTIVYSAQNNILAMFFVNANNHWLVTLMAYILKSVPLHGEKQYNNMHDDITCNRSLDPYIRKSLQLSKSEYPK